MRKYFMHRMIGLCAMLVCLSAYPAMGQPRTIDNVVSRPDSAEPWIFSITGTVTLPRQNRDETYKCILIYTQSARGGNIQLCMETIRPPDGGTPVTQPRRVPLDDFNYEAANDRYNWQFDGVWLGDKTTNDRRYNLYICLVSVRNPDVLLGLRATHNTFSDRTQLVAAIRQKCNLIAVTMHIADRPR